MYSALVFLILLHATTALNSYLTINIRNSGFHRDINYVVKFSESPKNCEFMLIQNLPASIFVNTDQLNDMKLFNKIKAYIPVYVDVEMPTAKSEPIVVFIYENINKAINITLPIHLRYHSPSDKKFERIEIGSPALFGRCDDEKIKLSTDSSTQQFPCSNSSSIIDYENILDIHNCDWQRLDIANAPTTLSVLVPVGNVHSYKFVLPVTIGISWLGCMYLVYVIIKKSKYLNKKLL